MSEHRWQYYLSGRVGDPPPTVETAQGEPHVRLYRTFDPVGAEAVLHPDGRWVGSELFLAARSQGELANLTPIDADTARRVVEGWVERGRQRGDAAQLVEDLVPGDYAERAEARTVQAGQAERVRQLALPAANVARVRSAVFGERDLAPHWCAEEGRVVVPVSYPVVLAVEEERGHLLDAYRATGAAELWLVTRGAEHASSGVPPDGVAVPLTPAGLAGLVRLPYLGDYVITDPALTRLLLHREDYWLVAGPQSFVTDVLGRSIPAAYALFRDQLAAADPSAQAELTAVLADYPPPVAG